MAQGAAHADGPQKGAATGAVRVPRVPERREYAVGWRGVIAIRRADFVCDFVCTGCFRGALRSKRK